MNTRIKLLKIPKAKSGIHIKKSHEGRFTEYCGGKVTSECIARGKRSPNPKVRKMSTFAANSRRWKHQEGGLLSMFQTGGKTPFEKYIERYKSQNDQINNLSESERKKQENLQQQLEQRNKKASTIWNSIGNFAGNLLSPLLTKANKNYEKKQEAEQLHNNVQQMNQNSIDRFQQQMYDKTIDIKNPDITANIPKTFIPIENIPILPITDVKPESPKTNITQPNEIFNIGWSSFNDDGSINWSEDDDEYEAPDMSKDDAMVEATFGKMKDRGTPKETFQWMPKAQGEIDWMTVTPEKMNLKKKQQELISAKKGKKLIPRGVHKTHGNLSVLDDTKMVDRKTLKLVRHGK